MSHPYFPLFLSNKCLNPTTKRLKYHNRKEKDLSSEAVFSHWKMQLSSFLKLSKADSNPT